MNIKTQKKLAAQMLKCSPSKVVFDTERLDEIKESITKVDIRSLIKDNAIARKDVNGPSKVRARKIAKQKSKGLRKGQGKRKGKYTARLKTKTDWINRVRKQRDFLKSLRSKETITPDEFKLLYKKSKGGFFRSLRHLKIYVTDIISKRK